LPGIWQSYALLDAFSASASLEKKNMRDIGTILLVLKWGFFLAACAALVWVIRNIDPFPLKRLRNIPFSEVKIGQTFYDYGGEELRLREYLKTDELEAQCMSVAGHPLVNFDKTDVVKIEVIKI
jgi:hypothetical protein